MIWEQSKPRRSTFMPALSYDCLCVCLYVHVCVCVVSPCVCTRESLSVYLSESVCVSINTSVGARAWAFVCVCVCECGCVCVCVFKFVRRGVGGQAGRQAGGVPACVRAPTRTTITGPAGPRCLDGIPNAAAPRDKQLADAYAKRSSCPAPRCGHLGWMTSECQRN